MGNAVSKSFRGELYTGQFYVIIVAYITSVDSNAGFMN